MSSILIVEDDKNQRAALKDMLEQNKYSVLEAEDGVQGLTMALREHPNLILLDVRMPGMDGMEMMHALRNNPWGKNASIIILTNYDNTEAQLVQITTDKPSYYLLKANTPLDTIADKIREILEPDKI